MYAELVGLLDRRPDWHRDALCREHPELDWLPPRGVDLRPMRLVCARCLVSDECLAAAEAYGDAVGVWGGTSDRERRRARAARSAAEAPGGADGPSVTTAATTPHGAPQAPDQAA